MPALPVPSLLHTAAALSSRATEAAGDGLYVVCAWPVSGQYGPGSRVLYYVLVATCVLAQKEKWLMKACLAAALIFPAIAAIHGITLAAFHVDGAVDMDIFGAFQLCSIGILAAPVTVKLSPTYFFNPGRNTIFSWTGLVLAGLLSLTVEFYRIKPTSCLDDFGHHISLDARKFPYGKITCGLVCSVDDGPFSPMRRDAANNIYVIPAPDKLTFGTGTLLAAACCVPAILMLISMLDKILEFNWKSHFRSGREADNLDEPIGGTNGATEGTMKGVNAIIRVFLSSVEIPVFSAAVLAILVIGERNFFSPQVRYQTEPMGSVGQWAPIAGTGLAALGSLYLLLAVEADRDKDVKSLHHCNCSHHHQAGDPGPDFRHQPDAPYSPSSRGAPSVFSSHSGATPDLRNSFQAELAHAPTQATVDLGNRRKVARLLTSFGNRLGAVAHDLLIGSGFKRGQADNFPEIPGEEQRNPILLQIRGQYNLSHSADINAPPSIRAPRSRATSFNGSVASGLGIDPSSTTPRSLSPRPPPPTADRQSLDQQNRASSSETPGVTPVRRRDTLEVPEPAYLKSMRKTLSA